MCTFESPRYSRNFQAHQQRQHSAPCQPWSCPPRPASCASSSYIAFCAWQAPLTGRDQRSSTGMVAAGSRRAGCCGSRCTSARLWATRTPRAATSGRRPSLASSPRPPCHPRQRQGDGSCGSGTCTVGSCSAARRRGVSQVRTSAVKSALCTQGMLTHFAAAASPVLRSLPAGQRG